jgi:uncharacterized protein YbjT (DUF2867 family)
MTILVTGATGRVGSKVVEQLLERGADVRVLVRDPSKTRFAPEVEVVQGDMLDLESLRRAFAGVSTFFLLNAVAADEFTQALIALNIAREAGVNLRQCAAFRGEVRRRANDRDDGLQRHDPASFVLYRQRRNGQPGHP